MGAGRPVAVVTVTAEQRLELKTLEPATQDSAGPWRCGHGLFCSPRVSCANRRSTRLSQLVEVGVKCR